MCISQGPLKKMIQTQIVQKNFFLRDPTRNVEAKLLETNNSRKPLPHPGLRAKRRKWKFIQGAGATFRSSVLEEIATTIPWHWVRKGSGESILNPLSFSILLKRPSASHLANPFACVKQMENKQHIGGENSRGNTSSGDCFLLCRFLLLYLFFKNWRES